MRRAFLAVGLFLAIPGQASAGEVLSMREAHREAFEYADKVIGVTLDGYGAVHRCRRLRRDTVQCSFTITPVNVPWRCSGSLRIRKVPVGYRMRIPKLSCR